MKQWLLVLLLLATANITKAQGGNADTLFRFNHKLSRCENMWIAFPKENATGYYAYGFLYIDPAYGFVFNLEGFFNTSGNGKFSRIKKTIDAETREQYVLKPGVKPLVAIVGYDHYEELDLYQTPKWLPAYSTFTDSAAHSVEWGRAYNSISDHEMALSFLEHTYQNRPQTVGLEFELCRAYNALKRYDSVIKVSGLAIKDNRAEPAIYKEFGNALLSKGDVDKALETYNTGIKLCGAGNLEEKSEMAMQMAIAYRSRDNKQGYKVWIQQAKIWAPRKSDIAATLADM